MSTLQSDITNAAQQLKLFQVDNVLIGQVPAVLVV
jgi:hypothetical protein